MQILIDLLGSKNFIPHGYCLNWSSTLLWLHVSSDAIIALSYYSIPLSLAYFTRKRQLPYRWLLDMFALFIIACGTTHLISLITIWFPIYWLDGYIKAFTAIVSLATALLIQHIIPLALQLPTTEQLQKEIAERLRIQNALEIANARFSALFNNMRNGVAVYEAVDKGNNFIFRDFNRAGEVLDSIKREELLNKLVTEVFPDVEQFGLLTVMRRVWQTGQAEHLPISLYAEGCLSVYRENYVYRLPTGEVVTVYEDITERKQSENELIATKNHLQATLDAIPDLLFELDLEGRYLSYHAPRTGLLTAQPEQFLGKTITEILPSEAASVCFAALYEAQQQGWSTGKEFQLPLPQGDHWFELSVARKSNDETPHFIVLSRDITVRKQVVIALHDSEQQLRDSKNFFQLLAQVNPMGLYQTDAAGQCLFVNEKWCEIAGMSFQQALGDGWHDAIMVEDRDHVYEEWTAAVRERRLFKLEYRFQQANNNIIWVYGLSTPIRDAQDNISGYIGTITDITERKRMESALLESEFLWKFAIEGSGDGVWDWNIQTNEALYSKYWLAMLGYGEHDLMPCFTEWKSRIYPDDRARVIDVLQAYLAGDIDIYRVEFRLRCKNGNYKWILARGILVSRSEDGLPLRMIGTHTDIDKHKHIEQALKSSEQRLNEIINLMPIAVFIKDAHSRMLIMNKACELQWGVPFAQLYNKTGSEIFPPEQIANFLAADKKIFAEGGVFEIEEQVWNTELQTNRIVHTFKKPVFNAAGQADYLIGLCVDITDTKQQEQALKASEARFRTIIDISPVPMALNDEHGAITFLNTAFVQTFGYDTTDIPTLTDWWPKAYPDPDYRQWVTDTWQATLETAEREHQPFVPQELNIHCKNGTQKTVLASTAAISETFNELHLVVLYDITERKQIENALRNSEHRLKEAERIARLGNWELDFLTNTLSWSDGIFQIFDIDKQQFVTTYDTFLAAIHPDDRDAVNTAYTASLKTHQPYHISHRLIMPDGQIKYVHEQCESYFDFEGKPIRSIGTIQDITERKIMEAELRRSNADLEQFAYAVSHDMRQPLRMISSYLSLLEQAFKNKLDEDTQQFMSFALDGAKRMDAMILSLLDYSRVGRRTEPFSLISSRAVVDEALVFLEPELKASGGQVEVTGQWVELLASRDELTRLLQNLIGNALKYHEENKPPYVEVRAIVTANTFKVAVRDSGIGIDPTQIDRLFKVFSRLQARTRFEGTGVGLALCRKIVEHHGGQIGVESTGEGHGCVFWFELPLIMKELE